MKKTVVAIAIVSVAFFAACNQGADSDQDTQDNQPATEASVQEDQSAQGISLSTTSGETIDPSAAPASGTAMTGGEGVKLNPPHGEPGHRCEIPVGAPLDSDPVNSNGMVQQQLIQDHAQPAAQPQPVQMPAGGQTARLNPPHGQPGHDCAVAVGAPLP